ncbi:hypothetical protein [Lacrimispora sp.]|uniref:hypothetical protein n=1 Tax=Lacrimispora sp. TaxID=2719234 RepID=UPI0028A9A199|nr:hypothetical protein [Lacrimispora sp.]
MLSGELQEIVFQLWKLDELRLDEGTLMTTREHIMKSNDVKMSLAIVFCIVEYLQQSEIIKGISMADKEEMISFFRYLMQHRKTMTYIDWLILGMQFNQSSWTMVRSAALVGPLSDESYDPKRLTFESIQKH